MTAQPLFQFGTVRWTQRQIVVWSASRPRSLFKAVSNDNLPFREVNPL